jgi:hypothetical protein
MSIQFRSRIRSTFDYGKELKQSGKCCFADGTSELITFYECFSRSGTFITDVDAPCPTSAEKGYCCACAYLSDSQRQEVVNNLPYNASSSFWDGTFGIQSDITECECNRIGGIWSNTNSSASLCDKRVAIDGSNYDIDARIPNACCSFIIQNGAPNGVTCQNVCSERACANLAIVESGLDDPFADTVFIPNKVCGKSIVSGVAAASCGTTTITSRLISTTDAFAEDLLGPCYQLNEETLEYTCSVQPEYRCSGYWVNPETIDSNVAYCDHAYTPKSFTKSSSYINPTQYTESEFDSLGLSIGDEFQGGIYIGKFAPKKPNATTISRVYGALNFSTPSSTYVDVSGESEYSKWAIIVNKNFLKSPLIYSTDPINNFTNSYYDGYMNCYGDRYQNNRIESSTINTIRGKLRNGFIDYYVPSIVEMMFLSEQYRNNTTLQDILTIDGTFASSTFVTDKYLKAFPTGVNIFNNMNLLYGQIIGTGENLGKNITFNINRTVNFFLFRRIILT